MISLPLAVFETRKLWFYVQNLSRKDNAIKRVTD